MSTHDPGRTTGGEERGDLPSGYPEDEHDHRTLADRLTGRPEAPEDDPHTARLGEETSASAASESEHTQTLTTPRPETRDTAATDDTQAMTTTDPDTRDTRSTDDTQVVPTPGADETRREGGQDAQVPERREAVAAAPQPHEVAARQKEDFGGVKIGAGFFGWLAATGLAVLLTALVAAVGTKVGVTDATVDDVTSQAGDSLGSVGLSGGIALLVIIVVSYYAGGYVAGRMARFNGIRQGLLVWLWAIVIAAVVAGAAAIWGSSYDILSTLNAFPRWPVDQGSLTTGGVLALVILALASLVGALLGGLAGMHFHRRVDKVALRD